MSVDILVADDLYDDLQNAGEVTMLMVHQYLVETLHRQAQEESREAGTHVSPGEILDKALKMYLEQHGKPEAVRYLAAVAEKYGVSR